MQPKPIKLLTFVEIGGATVASLLAFHYREIVGVFTRQMMLHIVLMMLAAPALAGLLRTSIYAPALASGIKLLPAAALLQSALFFAWHSPPGWAIAGHGGSSLMHITLLFSALWFWWAIFEQAADHLWQTVFTLLLTGKLFCLLAVLLVFAPRVLYAAEIPNAAISVDLGDQQLAGLLMLTACPLSYLLAAIVLVYRWFQRLDAAQDPIPHAGPALERRA